RTAFIRTQYGPLYRVFRQVKDLFDPENLLNPGTIINDDPHLTARNFRTAARPVPQTVELQLKWHETQMPAEAQACNGCGVCKTLADESRMCPFFRIDSVEDASPRAK